MRVLAGMGDGRIEDGRAPLVGLISPRSSLIKVDLPEPLGPTKSDDSGTGDLQIKLVQGDHVTKAPAESLGSYD